MINRYNWILERKSTSAGGIGSARLAMVSNPFTFTFEIEMILILDSLNNNRTMNGIKDKTRFY